MQLRTLCESEAARDPSASRTVEENISRWQNAADRGFQDPQERFIGVGDLPEAAEESDEVDLKKILYYRDFVITARAHEWLIGHIKHELNTTRSRISGIRPIGETILAQLSSSKSLWATSRSKNPGHCEARFSMSWDPAAFFNDQEYDVEYGVFLHEAIALTGEIDDAQATTVSEYLHQCWPWVAEVLLKAVGTAVGAAVPTGES